MDIFTNYDLELKPVINDIKSTGRFAIPIKATDLLKTEFKMV